ncbi:retrotransposon protein, putative, ty1-copia subclass [Tanacetum coccineum]
MAGGGFGYPKETTGYYFYYPLKNKKFVARYAEIFKSRLIKQEASGSTVEFDEIQSEEAQPSENTSLHQHEVEPDIVDPQTNVIPVRRSARIPQAPERYGFYIDAEEHESKWLFKKKTDMDGNIHTYKAHLVAKGFTQTYGVDYEETFSPVADIKAIRILIAITAYYDYEIWQMDVKTAFLNGRLNEDVYMVQPKGFVNPKHPGRDDLRSKTGFVFVMNGGAVDWKTSKQSTTAMSSMEAKYIAAAEAAIEVIWICKFIYGLGVVPSIDKPMDMYCDNTGAITIADEPGVQKGAKHFRRKYHFIREAIQEGDISILKVHTYNNLADPFTKPMPCTKHVEHARSIRLRPAGSFM